MFSVCACSDGCCGMEPCNARNREHGLSLPTARFGSGIPSRHSSWKGFAEGTGDLLTSSSIESRSGRKDDTSAGLLFYGCALQYPSFKNIQTEKEARAPPPLPALAAQPLFAMLGGGSLEP